MSITNLQFIKNNKNCYENSNSLRFETTNVPEINKAISINVW